jgi:hypothetical protein
MTWMSSIIIMELEVGRLVVKYLMMMNLTGSVISNTILNFLLTKFLVRVLGVGVD